MLLHYVLIVKDLKVLLRSVLIGKHVEEGSTRNRKRRVGSIEKQGLLLAFFCPWTGSLVF